MLEKFKDAKKHLARHNIEITLESTYRVKTKEKQEAVCPLIALWLYETKIIDDKIEALLSKDIDIAIAWMDEITGEYNRYYTDGFLAGTFGFEGAKTNLIGLKEKEYQDFTNGYNSGKQIRDYEVSAQ